MKHKLTENDRQILIEATQTLGDYTYENAFLYICELEKEVEFLQSENEWLQAELDETLDCIEECSKICDDLEGEDYE